MEKKQGRGKNPSTLTIHMLCAKAGGRCQFDGCNKLLFVDKITLKEFNNTNIAHIVASSPDGPRGSEKSYELSDKLENLMLMCHEHHKLIDDNPEEYTVDKLNNMKFQQELKVEKLLSAMDYPETEIVMLESPIKGKKEGHVDFKQAVEAIRENGKNPASNHGIPIKIHSVGKYQDLEYWKHAVKKLEENVKYYIEILYSNNPDLRLSIFPIAPIPLIAKLGNLLGDKKIIDIYQKTREPDTWMWQADEKTNSFTTEKIKNGEGNKVALILSLTAEVDLQRVYNVFEANIIYHLKANRYGVDCILSPEDLKAFWQEYQCICDNIKNEERIDEISVFPVIPVSAAFEIGRRHMTGVHPVMHIYEDDNGFFETITIGGNNNE